MRLPLAVPAIFRARAIAATGIPWLADGFHIRVKVHPWIGFPLHPFAAWRLPRIGEEVEPQIIWRNRDGKTVSMPFDIQQAGGEVYGTVRITHVPSPWVWIEFTVDDRGMRIDLLDSKLIGAGDRIVASRTREPFAFSDAELLYFRVTGEGEVIKATGVEANALDIEDIGEREPDFTFGLPIQTNEWYARDPREDPKDAAFRRVRAAAPTRRSPPDNPTGAMPATDPDAEAERIMQVVGPDLVDPWLAEGFGDAVTAPVASVHQQPGQTPRGKRLTASAPVTPSLLTMAVDPQIARYLGLATMVGFTETAPMARRNLWLIASRWAVQRDRIVRKIDEGISSVIPISAAAASVRLSTFLGSAGGVPPFVNAILDRRFPDAPRILARLPDIPDLEGNGRWSPVTLMALAVAPGDAPPDPPDRFELSADQPGAWNAHANPDAPGPESWRQTISLGPSPARGMVGFARMFPGEPVALHQIVPADDGPTARVLPVVPNWASNNERVLTDRFVPPDRAGSSWQVWHADEFGQWSEAAPYSAPLPARPLPPVPVAEATYAALPDDQSADARIPGTISLSLKVPTPAKSAPGSLPLAALDVSIDGVPQPAIPVTPGAAVRRDFQPRQFAVGEHRPVAIDVTFTDSDGQTSPTQTLYCGVFDARAPQAIPTSPLVVWTGRADAAGHAELALKWPPQAGAASYRVYLGDIRRLAGPAGVELTGSAVRSTYAKPIHDQSAAFEDKHLFTFLGETSATPQADEKIHYSTRIPASLRGLQFVRIVPMTQGGAEAPFAKCGLVPVAVPAADRPAPPTVEVINDPLNGVTVTVRARGLRKELLDAGAGKPPEFRIQRTRRANANRGYIPLRPEGGPLIGPDASGVWTAAFTVPSAELDPFVRYRWFAETRYPAEPPIPPGFLPAPISGIEPIWTSLGSDSESAWSDPSLAAESLLIPPRGPQSPPAPTLTRHQDGAIEIHVEDLPIAAPDAIGTYRLEIYRVTRNAPPTLVATATSSSGELSWVDTAPPPPGDSYALVLVDPIERRSPPTTAAPPPRSAAIAPSA